MSTRANVIIKGDDAELIFYRHSDGYPKCTGADLIEFVQGYKSGAMRMNVPQSAGWLIVKGHAEYLRDFGGRGEKPFTAKADESDRGYGWKVGAYEPTNRLHCDVEYVYIIDLEKQTLICREPNGKFWDAPSLKNTVSCKEFKTVSFAQLELVEA